MSVRSVVSVQLSLPVLGPANKNISIVVAPRDGTLWYEEGEPGITWLATDGKMRCLGFANCKAWVYDAESNDGGRAAKNTAGRRRTQET